jgi:TRAP-type C4-dicarboxylate transport system substrate-binding protein
MTRFCRRTLLKSSVTAAVLGVGALSTSRSLRAQAKEEFKFKLGTDLPAAHPVNVRLKEAIDAINSETNGRVALSLFPNNQLGSDSDMLSQIAPARSRWRPSRARCFPRSFRLPR